MKHKLQQMMIDILARCMDMTIATTRSDGSPQATVVSFVHEGLVLLFRLRSRLAEGNEYLSRPARFGRHDRTL